jgi:transcriptional regulator with XRE-family HTH domain
MALGKILRETREQQGYSVTQVAEATHMMIQIVEEIEREDFHRIAAPLYGRGFVKMYAEFLNIDAEPLVKEFNEIYSGARRPAVATRVLKTISERPAAPVTPATPAAPVAPAVPLQAPSAAKARDVKRRSVKDAESAPPAPSAPPEPQVEEVRLPVAPQVEEVRRPVAPQAEEVRRPVAPQAEEVRLPVETPADEVNLPVVTQADEVSPVADERPALTLEAADDPQSDPAEEMAGDDLFATHASRARPASGRVPAAGAAARAGADLQSSSLRDDPFESFEEPRAPWTDGLESRGRNMLAALARGWSRLCRPLAAKLPAGWPAGPVLLGSVATLAVIVAGVLFLVHGTPRETPAQAPAADAAVAAPLVISTVLPPPEPYVD